MDGRLALSRDDSRRHLYPADYPVDWPGGHALRRLYSRSNPRSRTPRPVKSKTRGRTLHRSQVEPSKDLYGTSLDREGAWVH